ncbi:MULTISPECIES: MspA family porin [unclassified Mycobacteroides]|uniref:MspA family porin n=1 Tax=unclassified Mycobacteroides TaxID=2618759 RepID=UPI0035C7CC94
MSLEKREFDVRTGASRSGMKILGWGLGVTLAIATAGVSHADPQVMPFKQQQFVTADGWVVDVTLSNEIIDHIDNLAGASNSWQARISLRAEANITGTGSSPIQDGQLESGYFVGCRTDSSPGVELGGGIAGGAGLYEVGGGQGGFPSGGTGAGAIGASQNVGIGGSIRVLLKPGGLAQVPLDRINLRDTSVVSEFNNQNLEADGCGGQVKIQSYATIKIRTKRGNNTQTIYGDPKDL